MDGLNTSQMNSLAMGQYATQKHNAVASKLAAASGGKVTKDTELDANQLTKIKESAKEFESVFLSEMLKPMFEGVSKDPMFGSNGEDIFHGMMVQEYGKMLSDRGGIGLADQIEKYMIEVQEGAQ